MYACINVLTKLMYFQQTLYLLGVNKYYGYGCRVLETIGSHSSTTAVTKLVSIAFEI